MKNNIVIAGMISLLFVLIINSCSDSVSPSPPDIPVETLLAAPQSVVVSNKTIVLSTYLWRDFMPISPPGGKSLIAIAYIETKDSSAIPGNIGADAIYIVKGDSVWKSFFSEEGRPPGEAKPYRIVKIARSGPTWQTLIYVDVIVSLRLDNKTYLLRASKQFIGRTD